MKQKILLLILFIIFSNYTLFAQNKYTFTQFANETVTFVKQPVKWTGNDYLKIGLIAVGTGLTMFADQPIRSLVKKDQSYYYSFPIVLGRMYGELYSPVAFFGGFAIYSLITGDILARKIAYEIGQASLYAGGLTFLLKMSIGRARPFMEEGATSYHPFSSIFIQDYHSLPGGHSTAAFTISTVLSRNAKSGWLKVLFYVPAVFTMISRVYQDQHWTSDNVMGAALGYYIATWCVDKHEKAAPPDSKAIQQGMMERNQYQPIITGEFNGINLVFRIL
ncbi:MAG: phosphatase PAP2 family protein [FCB group bacterium]|jgi:membrane-associated phospholipid phosphatase